MSQIFGLPNPPTKHYFLIFFRNPISTSVTDRVRFGYLRSIAWYTSAVSYEHLGQGHLVHLGATAVQLV